MITRLVIIGGSAGSLEVALKILAKMPADLPHPVVLILHRMASEDHMLEDLFAAKCELETVAVEDKTLLSGGKIFIAPSDYHLLFEGDGTLSLDTSPKVNYSRPSIDVSFESAADAWKDRVTGILLSGANADGSRGLEAIKKAGGTTVVQDPATAAMPVMPQSAIDFMQPDLIAGKAELVRVIQKGII